MRREIATGSLLGALALLAGCQTLGLTSPKTVTGEEVLGRLEATERPAVPPAPEIVSLPPAPPPLPPAPPPALAPAPAPRPVAARAAEEVSFDEEATVPASVKSEESGRPARIAAAAAGGKTHKVVRGETLQKISQKYYGTTTKWMKIYEANKTKLKKPDLIVVGMTLTIP